MSNGGAADLPFLRGDADHVALRGGTVLNRTTFLAEVAALARQLPDRSHVVNLCSDRYRFVVAWAAAMLRRQITLLPGGRDPASVLALLADYPLLYVLSDAGDDVPGVLAFAYPEVLCGGAPMGIPSFPGDQIAAVLFTSGSTGRPNASVRRWGRLVAGSLAAGAALGVSRFAEAAVIATVPHAHSYGLESAVMLALQHGLLLTAERPFFPADVAAGLSGRRPGILVTTPVHLRALAGDAAGADPGAGFGVPARPGFVLSATAALSEELAAVAEATFDAPVFEIYGCSEAGQLATRRTTDGPVWRCLDGFGLRQDDAGTWACGPDEPDALLADVIELTGGGEFILQGRLADMVNVAGKRSSLGYLNRQLTGIDGVQDGVFVVPDDVVAGGSIAGRDVAARDVAGKGVAGAPVRLAAVAVAPALNAASIIAALRARIDPAFLPRPLYLVAALPRDALGKVPRAAILRVIEAAGVMPEAPDKVMPGAPDKVVLVQFPADHPAGDGHFPGNAIIPGAALLDAVVGALFPLGWAGGVPSAKFHHPVRPGDSLAVTRRTEGASIRFECRLVGTEQLAVSGVLRPSSPSR